MWLTAAVVTALEPGETAGVFLVSFVGEQLAASWDSAERTHLVPLPRPVQRLAAPPARAGRP